MRDSQADLDAIKAFTDERMIYDITKGWLKRAIKAEAKTFALREENERQRQSIQELSEQLAEAQADITMARVTNDQLLDIIIDLRKELEQLQKVVDVAKDIAVNLVNMKCENPESVIFRQRLKQTYSFNKLLLKALAELEVQP